MSTSICKYCGFNAGTEADRILHEAGHVIQQMDIQEYNEPRTNDHDLAVQRALAWDKKRQDYMTQAHLAANEAQRRAEQRAYQDLGRR